MSLIDMSLTYNPCTTEGLKATGKSYFHGYAKHSLPPISES